MKAEDLKKRVEIINKPDVDFFASIHLNALTSSRSKGAQTFYYRSSIENERAGEGRPKFIGHNEMAITLDEKDEQLAALV